MQRMRSADNRCRFSCSGRWHPTAWRRVADLAGDELSVARLDAARQVRAAVWPAGGAPLGADRPLGAGAMCIDVDATLVTAHSDKQSAAGTYKGGFGFHPLLAYLYRGDGTGEALAGMLVPRNAGANTRRLITSTSSRRPLISCLASRPGGC